MNINKKKVFTASVIVLLIIIVLSFIIYKRSYYDFTIVFTANVHAQIDQYLGYSRLSTVIKDIEKKDRRPLVFDAGDTFTGSSEATITDGQYIVSILNAVGYSAMGLGSRDLGFSLKSEFENILSNLSFPVVSTNIIDKNHIYKLSSSLIIPYRINLFKKIKIGIISLITPQAEKKNSPVIMDGLEISTSFELVQNEVNKLKEKTDFIVLLSYLNSTSNSVSSEREETGFYLEKVLSKVKGIDLVIAGHLLFPSSHDTVVDGVPLFFAWEYLKYIGVLNIKKELFKKWNINSAGIDYRNNKNNIEPDPKMVEFIDKLNKNFQDKYNVVIGSSKDEIPLEPKIRQNQTQLGRWLADALMKDKNVDIAIINSGSIRSGIKKGTIIENDVLLIFPFKDKTVSVEISGEELKNILERAYSFYPTLFSGMLQISSNVEFKVNLDEKPYNRILNVTVSGKPLDKNKKYKILISDFLKHGGDGYTIFKDKKVIKEFTGYLYENLKTYIQNNSPISL